MEVDMHSLLERLIRRTACEIKLLLLALRQKSPYRKSMIRLNLCGGPVRINGYLNVDIGFRSDLPIDLARRNLPFHSGSIEVVVCMSAINYFTRARAAEIIRETHRVLRPGGVARFGVQDLETIAARYVNKDLDFFFQKRPDGQDRFEGPTLGRQICRLVLRV